MMALLGVAAGRGAAEAVGRATPDARLSNSGRCYISKDKCRYCGIEGHWAPDYRKKKREEANLA